jgi:magnesium transporter
MDAISAADPGPLDKDQAPGPSDAAETARSHMVTRIPTARPGDPIGSVLTGLAGGDYESVGAVYVVDDSGCLQGLVRLPRLLSAGMQHSVSDVMEEVAPVVGADEDQERVVAMAVHHGVAEVPVVDENWRLLGAVPSQALMRIQHREHLEDFDRLAGILHDQEMARAAIEGRVLSRVMNRLPWLLLGLMGGAGATWVMAAFEEAMATRIAVVFFIPAIVYLAGAVGTQTVAIAVRWLSMSQLSIRRLMVGELYTGAVIGLVLAAVTFPMIYLVLGDPRLALAVSLSLVMAGAISTTIGLILPWFLWKIGRDPALGSGPVATILQDVFSLVAYFVVVSAILF